MRTKPYVANFKLLVKALDSSGQTWIDFGQFKKYLNETGTDYSQLESLKVVSSEDANNATLLSRFFAGVLLISSSVNWLLPAISCPAAEVRFPLPTLGSPNSVVGWMVVQIQ